MPKLKPKKELYSIIDPTGFRRELDRAVKRRRAADGVPGFDGNESRAAAHAGIAQSQIHRLRRKTPGRIARETYEALVKLIAPDRRARFRETLLPAVAAADIRTYHQWVRDEQVRLAGMRGQGLRDWESGEDHQREASRIAARIRHQLSSHAKLFDSDIQRLGHEPDRLNLAWARIIAPLVDHVDAGGIERSVDGLTDQEFADFIKAGIRRERVLLRREPALAVAQRRAKLWIEPVRPGRPATVEGMRKLIKKIREDETRWT